MKKKNWEVVSRFYIDDSRKVLVSPVMRTSETKSTSDSLESCDMYIDVFTTRKEAREHRKMLLECNGADV